MAELALCLELAEFGGAFVEEAVGLGAGAIDGLLDLVGGGAGHFHGVEDVAATVVETDDDVGFYLATTAKTPHGAMDLIHEIAFEWTGGREGIDEVGFGLGVNFFFAGADEIAVSKKAFGDRVFGGCRLARVGARSGGGLGVDGVG